MRFHWLISAAAVALLMQLSPSARAGLVGDNNSVAALFYLGASAVPPITAGSSRRVNSASRAWSGQLWYIFNLY
jgi:hypothetical protein